MVFKKFSSILIVVLTLSSILSCNEKEKNQPFRNVEKNIGEKADEIIDEMNKDIKNEKLKFEFLFNKKAATTENSLDRENLNMLFYSVTTAEDYLDSLRSQVQSLDDDDLNNIKKIKEIFIFNGIGDSVFNKLQVVKNNVDNFSLANPNKILIRNMSDSILIPSNIEAWKTSRFSLVSPLGAYLILSGLQNQLYSLGAECLK